MVIRIMEMLFEYMSFVLCIHKIAKRKIDLNIWLVLPFFMEVLYVLTTNMAIMPMQYRFIVFGGIFIYTKIKIVDTWKNAVKVCGMMLVIMMSLQGVQYFLLNSISKEIVEIKYEGIIVNINICILAFLWKEKYKNIVIEKLSKTKSVIIGGVILARVLYLLSQDAHTEIDVAIRFLIEIIVLSIICILWISVEKENNHRLRELRMYEMYNQAFEEAIMMIRARQHEFENHISAIKCMQYMITNHKELVLAQEQYCEKVLKENKLNKLLKLNVEPVLIGFLYSKLTAAEEKGISTKYEIQSVDIKEKIAIYEFIEVIGILFDNAVEALEKSDRGEIILKLQVENENSFSLEIANMSRFYSNSEIEKFFTYGYSTKGEKRGIGLSRVKEIAKKYNSIYQVQNCTYNEDNYLSFKLIFK